VGATYEVEAKPSNPAIGFRTEAEPLEKPVLTLQKVPSIVANAVLDT
jgi:hypothetical protein